MNIIIPLNGKGERFSKEGYTQPKPLIKVFDKPIIEYVIDNLNVTLDDNIYIIYNEKLDDFNFCNIITQKYKSVNLIKLNKNTDGAIETIFLAIQEIIKNNNINKKTMIIDGDTFYTYDIINEFKNNSDNILFYRYNTNTTPLYSYLKLEDNNIIEIKEKIKISDNAVTGAYCFQDINQLYYFSKYIIDNNIKSNNEYYMSCVIDTMIKQGHNFKGICIPNDTIYSLGTPNELNTYITNTYGILFDLDGTIIISDDIYYQVWMEILSKYNITLNQHIFTKYIQGKTDNDVITNLLPYGSIDIENISKQKDELFIKNIDKLEIISGAIDFIKYIKKMGHKICIVTNCNRTVAEYILNYIDIYNIIDKLIIGNECNQPKPSPEPYIAAMTFLNIDNKKCIIFEDSKSGIHSGLKANPLCICGIDTIYNKSEILNMGCNFCFSNYNNININDLFNYTNNNNNLIEYISNTLNINQENIIIDDIKLKGGFISDVFIIKTNTNNYVFKCESKNDSFLLIMAENLDLYNREYYFYESISKYVNINIPSYYGTVRDNNLKPIGIILENLFNNNMIPNLDLNTESIDVSLKIIDSLAKMHAKFWNKEIFPLLKKHNDKCFCPKWENFINERILMFVNKWKYVLNTNQINIAKNIASNYHKIQNNLSDKNLTLCHGDVKSPNIFYKKTNYGYEPYFIDWQYIAYGKGIQDIIFFMIESFEINKMNYYYDIFINYYYSKILEYGIKYNISDYKKDIINAICYFPFFVAIWFGTVDEKDLIDKNFPFFFIQKLFNFIEKNVPSDYVF
jgi:HAD superfamily hydrolase (TIGR01509 family)